MPWAQLLGLCLPDRHPLSWPPQLLEAGVKAQFDLRSRETTFIHHVFAGYTRNQVECLRQAAAWGVRCGGGPALFIMRASIFCCGPVSLPLPQPPWRQLERCPGATDGLFYVQQSKLHTEHRPWGSCACAACKPPFCCHPTSSVPP